MEEKKISTLIVDNAKVDELRNFARKFGVKPNKENVINFAMEVAILLNKYADEETINNLLNQLKPK